MRSSKLFFRTFKEAPQDADIISHQLLERGGFIKKLGKGIFSYTPLMVRVLDKICAIVREEMEAAGAQEVSLPYLHPAAPWKKSGRWEEFTAEKLLYTLEDREGHDYCLAPTHEEVVVSLVANWATSYKQFPFNLFQIGTKFRDEIRPRFGLMRGKEFLMKDGYAFCQSEAEMDAQYEAMTVAYTNIFKRLGLHFVVVNAHGGKIGKGRSEEFQVVADVGEDAIMVCGEYAANVEATVSIPAETGVKEVKRVVYHLVFADTQEKVVIAMRADREINALKVAEALGAIEAFATEEKVDPKMAVHADKTAGGEHDFLLAQEGDGCPHVEGGVYKEQRGIEVGHIFNIGTKYTEALGATFQDVNGKPQPIWMGTYGMGIGRTAAACVEQSHDERGIIWPRAIAPFGVVIIPASMKEEAQVEAAEKLYSELKAFDPLLDDRGERLGFKLKDSDLIGIPYKVIIGKTFTNEGKVELESRTGEKEVLTLEEVASRLS